MRLPVTSTLPATSSTDVVASTSGLNIAAAAATSTTATATTSTSIDNHSDEVNTSIIVNDDDFGTQNLDFLDIELIEADKADLSATGLQVTNFKSDPTPSESDNEAEIGVTHFRAATDGEKRGSNKFFHIDTSLETESD